MVAAAAVFILSYYHPNVSFFWWSVCICYSVKFISSIQYISLCWLNKSDANKFNNFIGFVRLRARACLCMWVSLLLFFCLNSSLLEMIIDSTICPLLRIDNNETRIGSNSQYFTSQWKIRQQAYGHSKATRQKRSYCVRAWEKKACVHPSPNHFFIPLSNRSFISMLSLCWGMVIKRMKKSTEFIKYL